MSDRHWLLTSTTYGNWLPGDRRGFVGPIRDGAHVQVIHNIPGTDYDRDEPGLKRHARIFMRGPPIRLVRAQAEALLLQFHETANHCHWSLRAIAIMANHFHLVVGVIGDPPPEDILGRFKSYGSRRLNRIWGKPESGTWWTESGSKRKLDGEDAIVAGVNYVRNQEYALVIWIAGEHPVPMEPGGLTPPARQMNLLASGRR